MDLSHSTSTNLSSNQNKKSERSDIKYNKNVIKSNEILRQTSKYSYFNKYLEECNRTKMANKKIGNLKQPKIKTDKDIHFSYNNNLSPVSQRKNKNNSMDKKILMKMNSNDNKKGKRNLNIDKINNDEFINKKSQNINTSTISDNNETYSNRSMSKTKDKMKKSLEKNVTKKINSFPYNIPQIKNLSNRENAFLILSYSDTLRLCERFIFSRSTLNLRRNISKNQIFETNKIYLNEKLKELDLKLNICNEKLNTKFLATKTAEMTLNFITTNIENEFRLNTLQFLNDKNEKEQYYNYIKLLYILLDESYEQISNKDLTKQLYQKINNKGFTNIKDYLYFIYIKNLKENKLVENSNEIEQIIKNIPNFLNYQNCNKFVSYCCYLIKEIINFVNDKIDTLKLKKDCINLIDVINNKLNLYNDKKYINNNK